MNINFNILWFEDEPEWFRMERRYVQSILEKHCLIPAISQKKGDDFNIDEICNNSYDLILMDFKLADKETGDNIAKAIRNKNVLTDILFYSSDTQGMLSKIYAADPPLGGIYFAKRDYEKFAKEVEGLIAKIVKRAEDIVNLRGFVMDDSCDFENRVQEMLTDIWPKLNNKEQDVLELAISGIIDHNHKRMKKTEDKVSEYSPKFPAAVDEPYFFSHSDRLSLLNNVIQILQSDYSFKNKDDIWKNFKANYEGDISCYRNALGHKKNRDAEIKVKGELVPINQELHELMRRNIHQYDDLIKILEKFISNL